MDCVVEVNVGQDRCGVEPGKPAVELAKHILELPNVTFKGIQCYQGWNQHVRKIPDRKEAVGVVIKKTRDTLQAFKEAGIDCPYVTGGGTGTYLFEADSGVFTEVQPVSFLIVFAKGSYIFMDADYNKNLDVTGNFAKDFVQSLYVLGTIQSVTKEDRAVIDAGMKAVEGHPNTVYNIGGDEHGILIPGSGYKVGDLVMLIPGHCDPTVNMYDWLIGIRDSKVESLWPVLGRGPGV
ncbi:hypothetical protein LSH36_1074g00003 [Paralvinella palmiformis]|uniref:D-serine dehydratase-like domain-containing protein n=1 Tax=Paralvinella palmiformis TaxID=53620 RepID=A0AAD9MRW6_9ANNE|nr:hypothetical protein LSH36_1074g00003 [Paralvinella palmiformis]